MRVPSLILAALSAAVLLGGTGVANAQYYSDNVVARCSQAIGQFKFEGYPAERNQNMMLLACEQNGGTVPGTPQETRPAALHPHCAGQR